MYENNLSILKHQWENRIIRMEGLNQVSPPVLFYEVWPVKDSLSLNNEC